MNNLKATEFCHLLHRSKHLQYQVKIYEHKCPEHSILQILNNGILLIYTSAELSAIYYHQFSESTSIFRTELQCGSLFEGRGIKYKENVFKDTGFISDDFFFNVDKCNVDDRRTKSYIVCAAPAFSRFLQNMKECSRKEVLYN